MLEAQVLHSCTSISLILLGSSPLWHLYTMTILRTDSYLTYFWWRLPGFSNIYKPFFTYSMIHYSHKHAVHSLKCITTPRYMSRFQKKKIKHLLFTLFSKEVLVIWPLRKKVPFSLWAPALGIKELKSMAFWSLPLWNKEHIRTRWYCKVPVMCVQ